MGDLIVVAIEEQQRIVVRMLAGLCLEQRLCSSLCLYPYSDTDRLADFACNHDSLRCQSGCRNVRAPVQQPRRIIIAVSPISNILPLIFDYSFDTAIVVPRP